MSDLALLTDPEVKRVVADRAIELISVSEVEDSTSAIAPPRAERRAHPRSPASGSPV